MGFIKFKGEFKIEPLNEDAFEDRGFEDNARVIANLKGGMKVFVTTGSIAKECSELFTRITFNESSDEQKVIKETIFFNFEFS